MSFQASYCQEWNVVCPVPVFPTTQKLVSYVSCYGLSCVFQNLYADVLTPPVPKNVTLFGKGFFFAAN